MAQEFDTGALRLRGESEPVVDPVGFILGAGWPAASVSGTGLLAANSTVLATQPIWFDRTGKRGSAITAEKELEHKAKRVESFKIHPLSEDQCERFIKEWRGTQEQFVDDPRGAVADADVLVQKAMKARGYPVGGEFNQRAADLSVDHPRVVENYRAGHDVTESDAKKPASTENLRLAMKHYRALFEDLLGRPVDEVTGVRR